MKTIKYLLTAVMAITIFMGMAQRTSPPPAGTPKDFTLPAKTAKSLENGMKAMLVQYGAVPKATVNLIIKTGNVHEAADQVWLADLTGSLIQEGTATMDFAAISKKVASMGGEINISVGPDEVRVSGAVLSEYTSDLIAIMGEMVMNPALPASEVDRLKNDLKRQLAVQSGVPQSQASAEFFKTIYPDHPYGRYFPTEEMLDSYTIDMVKDFYTSNFGAQRSVLYVVGKFDEAAVAQSFEKTFTPWAAGPEVSYPPVTAQRTDEIAVIDRKGAPQTTIMVGLPTLTPAHPDYVALEVTNSLLGGSFGSRITRNIREDKGYTYSPRSSIRNRQGTSVWLEQADVTTEHTSAALTEISKEINRLQSEPPTKEEVEGIQKYEAGIFVLRNSTPGGITSQLNFIDQNGLDDSYLTDRVKSIYAVTPEKMSEIAREYLKYEDMTLIMVGDKEILDKQRSELEESRKL